MPPLTLTLRLDFQVEETEGEPVSHVALVKVVPWLSYGCGEGARVAVRSPGAIEGRCATVQRPLRDDSVVLRYDGLLGESSVDPSPLTVVRTTSPRHPPGTRLLFLHEKACVDATVTKKRQPRTRRALSLKLPHAPFADLSGCCGLCGQVEKGDEMELDVKEGTRHRLTVMSAKVTGWVSMKTRDGSFNLREVGTDSEGHTTWVVITYKPLIARTSHLVESEKAGTIAPKQVRMRALNPPRSLPGAFADAFRCCGLFADDRPLRDEGPQGRHHARVRHHDEGRARGDLRGAQRV